MVLSRCVGISKPPSTSSASATVDEDGAGKLESDVNALAAAARAYVESAVPFCAESRAKVDPWALKELRAFLFPPASAVRACVIAFHARLKP
jgi:hypothetical protein